MKYIQNIEKLHAYPTGDTPDNDIDVAVFYSEKNECEMQDDRALQDIKCTTTHNLYFGTSDSREPKFCPAHYFSDLGYTIEQLDGYTCTKCGVIHDVEQAGGHDLIQADKVARCECAEHPDDEYCQQILGTETE
jgi:hypothetical protein